MVEQYYSGAAEVSSYTCHRVAGPLVIDGDLEKEVWKRAPKSRRFVDVINGRACPFDTRAAALWDDQYLYIGFWVEEPSVEAKMTERDSVIFNENDVEVFIDGGDCYYEFEINALNTIYEVFFIWQDAYTRGGRFDTPEFDLFGGQATGFGGNFDRIGDHFWWGAHPRGARWAFPRWDFPGLKSAVKIDGTLNDPTTVDRGWTVELAFPWAGMGQLGHGRSIPPAEGDIWRMMFARYQKMNHMDRISHTGWAADRIGSMDNHVPECWTRVEFSSRES